MRSMSPAGRGLRCASVAAVLTALAIVAGTASATAPGRNGSIAFRRYFNDQHSRGAVFTIRTNGTHARQITHPPKGVVDDGPDWAPDRSLITFTRCPAEGLCHVYVVRPDGNGLTPVGSLCPPGATKTPVRMTRPLASRLIPSSSRSLNRPVRSGPRTAKSSILRSRQWTRNGSNRHVIFQPQPYAADLLNPMVSPKGRQIVFEWFNSPSSSPANREAIYVINTDGALWPAHPVRRKRR